MGEKFDKIKNKNHKNFILEYVKYHNATLAYKKVFPKVKDTTARVNGSRLLTNADILEAVQELFDDLWKSRINEIGETFDDLLKLARSDIKEVIDYDGKELTIRKFDEIDTRAIQSIDVVKEDTKYGEKVSKKVRLHSKTAALSDLLKVLEMMQDKKEVNIGKIIIKPAIIPPGLIEESNK